MENTKNTFFNLAVQAAELNPATNKAQRTLIDNVTAESPILRDIPFEKASHPYHNVFERLTDATGIDTVELDGPLPELSSNSQIDQINLTPLGGRLTFGEDRAKAYGSKENYLTQKIPPTMRKSGQRIEKTLFMSNFLGSCVRFGKAYSCTDNPADTADYSAMVAITWTPGEVTGLFSPLPYAEPRVGKVFETKWLSGGNVYDDLQPQKNGTFVKTPSYGAYVKTMIGMQIENGDKVAALVNIAIAEAKPRAWLRHGNRTNQPYITNPEDREFFSRTPATNESGL